MLWPTHLSQLPRIQDRAVHCRPLHVIVLEGLFFYPWNQAVMRQHKRTPISAGLTAFDLYTVLCNLHGCKRYTFLATGSLSIRRGRLTEFGDPPHKILANHQGEQVSTHNSCFPRRDAIRIMKRTNLMIQRYKVGPKTIYQ